MNDKVGSIVLNDDKQVKIFDSELKVLVCHSAFVLCEKEEIGMSSLLGVQIGFTGFLLLASLCP